MNLPTHLAERVSAVADRPLRGGADFVLYWMRTAVRGHDNPALDVAVAVANERGLPVFVYHAVSERYPFASDRHHAFILQGAMDVREELASRGVGYALHVERPGHRGPHLKTLAQRAALVVTEAMPVRPLNDWTRRLAEGVDTPVWTVDTACVVPMLVAGRAYDRAFAYRRATAAARRERLRRDWPHLEPSAEAFVPDLPFEPVDAGPETIPDLVAACDIDHAVGPVGHTPGGGRAGYARWEAFKQDGLRRYAADRNDPLRNGVSRLSPYLHYGQVSPFRIAREAAAFGGPGAEKFLDELLVWRELAYAYCFYRDDHDTPATLPDWARDTLRAHEGDARPADYGWETLARAATGDALWNAAQTSLLVHGELHNNVRMTWGKALLSWTPDAERALERLIDLNHRYALDGRDPASFGGILWCLGQFDRPFHPERPIVGSVRPRPTAQHAKRLDVAAYARATAAPSTGERRRVAVIGAGVSGLACARTLDDHGHDVTVFDKGRRPGGRISTRSFDGVGFDHGAQYFTARDPRFARYVDSWAHDGVVAEWRGRIVSREDGAFRELRGSTRRWVGVPGMSAVATHLATGLDVHAGVRIDGLLRAGGAWTLRAGDDDLGPFDTVVVALPAPQAAPLLAPVPALRDRAAAVTMNPCWAVMLRFEAPPRLDFDAAFVNEGPLSWIARNDSKPGRRGETWVLHASAAWSRAHLDDTPEDVAATLAGWFHALCADGAVEPVDATAHRWRHAIPDPALEEPCLDDPESDLLACGDWCGGPRVEGAFLSGMAAAGRLLGRRAAKTVRREAALEATLF